MQRLMLFLGAFSLCVGCSKPLAPGAGVVYFDDGEPVRSGSIEFRSIADGTRFSSRISADGEFDLADAEDRKGIKPGSYEVIVVQIVLTEDLAIEEHRHGHTVPRRYADYYTSDLELNVVDNQTKPLKVVIGVD